MVLISDSAVEQLESVENPVGPKMEINREIMAKWTNEDMFVVRKMEPPP
jgi:hypothetical protein